MAELLVGSARPGASTAGGFGSILAIRDAVAAAQHDAAPHETAIGHKHASGQIEGPAAALQIADLSRHEADLGELPARGQVGTAAFSRQADLRPAHRVANCAEYLISRRKSPEPSYPGRLGQIKK
jgi:hypothetical protein